MHRLRRLSHPAMFQGRGSIVYNFVVPRFTRRLHQLVIDDVANTLTAGTVLDVGTGPGQLVLKLARQQPDLKVEGVDTSADMITLAWQNAQREGLAGRVHFYVNTEETLPYHDQSVDLVISTLSMHHWDNAEAMVKELARVVRPGGQIMIYDIQVPALPLDEIEQALPHLPLADMQVERIPIRLGLLPILKMVHCTLRRV